METVNALDTRTLLDALPTETVASDLLAEEDDDPIVIPCYDYDDEGYLVSDGLPMAEHDIHRKNMTNVIEALEAHFLARGVTAYVAGNNFLHYQEGDRTQHVSPDCYVAFGSEQRIRENYKSWEEEGCVPSVVVEITSKKTQKTDEVEKFLLYERTLGVQEYLRFDPRGDYLQPKLHGYTLVEGRYERMPYEPDGRLYSAELDLYLETQGLLLRLYDAKTGEYLRTPAEAEQERVQEKERAERERQRANAAEGREDAERKRAEAAESELARLRAELAALRQAAGSQNAEGA